MSDYHLKRSGFVMRRRNLLGLTGLMLLACSTLLPTPAPTPTPLPTFTPSPTFTATPLPSPTPTPTATPIPPPTLQGRLLVQYPLTTFDESGQTTVQVLMLENLSGSGEIVETPIMSYSDSRSLSVSPDGRYLISAEDVGVIVNKPVLPEMRAQLLDLTTLESRPLRTEPSANCIQWSPDSAKFSYIANFSLYIHDLASDRSRSIYTAPSALYTGNGTTQMVASELSCEGWIGNGAYLFQRYVGSMPRTLSTNTLGVLVSVPANRTSLVLVEDNYRVINTEELINVAAVAEDGAYAILLKDGDELPFLTPAFADFAGIQPISLERLWPWTTISIASQTHRLILKKPDNTLAIVDLESLETLKTFNVPDAWPKADDMRWVGDPANGLVVFQTFPCEDAASLDSSPDSLLSSLSPCLHIGDLNTGQSAKLWQPLGNSEEPIEFVEVLAWLP